MTICSSLRERDKKSMEYYGGDYSPDAITFKKNTQHDGVRVDDVLATVTDDVLATVTGEVDPFSN